MEQETIVINLPLMPNRRSGRKYLIAPDGATVPMTNPTPQLHTMQKALVRAFLWRREIEEGKYSGIMDMARSKKLNEDFAFRQIALTFLAPPIVEAILDNRQPSYLTLQHLYKLIPLMWDEQEALMKTISC